MPNQGKLSPEQVREIRKHFKLAEEEMKRRGLKIAPYGMNQRLAKAYGVSVRMIEHLRTGDRHKGVR